MSFPYNSSEYDGFEQELEQKTAYCERVPIARES